MLTDMLAYLVWIMLTIGAMAFVLHILRLDRPRAIKIPVRKDEIR